ncbi:MAG: membrane protein insertion efficiency factor YidD [Planctomycetota bacterium]
MSWLLIALIKIYRRLISPILPPSCRFTPTCSQYGLDAIRIHGALKGGLLTTWRILRCAPWSKGGWDPAPEKGRWRSDPLPTQEKSSTDDDSVVETTETKEKEMNT